MLSWLAQSTSDGSTGRLLLLGTKEATKETPNTTSVARGTLAGTLRTADTATAASLSISRRGRALARLATASEFFLVLGSLDQLALALLD
jgi:hypothetical protein